MWPWKNSSRWNGVGDHQPSAVAVLIRPQSVTMHRVDSDAEDRRANAFFFHLRVRAQIRVSWCQKLDGMKLSILSAKNPRGAKSVLKN